MFAKLLKLSPLPLFVALVVSLLVCGFSLRHNNEHMLKLRDAVYSADKAGSDVTVPLQSLQAYVTTHMNTNLDTGVYPPIQLKYTYDRLVQAQGAATTAQNSQNSQVYVDAQKACEAAIPTGFSGRGRVGCIEDYVSKHTTTSPVGATIPDALYKFSFVSPRWSPDLAGWSVVASAVLAVLLLISLVIRFATRSKHS
ncbi:MAG: hypothetical protein JWN38_751 [Candidatus Saccharibacteria bacterium]|nr:hypothetical protein [Candidatus Saccharibacteria bacterium]